jgi:hypothetical protein
MASKHKHKDINLLEALDGKKKSKISLGTIIALAVIPLAAALTIVLIFLSFNTINTMSAERDSLKNYVEGTQTEVALSEVVQLQASSSELRATAAAVMSQLFNLSSYPDLSEAEFTQIFDLAAYQVDLTGIKYDRRTGILSFNATASDLISLPRFVEQMRASGMFRDIQYRGYIKTETAYYPLTGSGQTTKGSDEQASEVPTYIIDSYYYAVECLVTPPVPNLPGVVQATDANNETEDDASADPDTASGAGSGKEG